MMGYRLGFNSRISIISLFLAVVGVIALTFGSTLGVQGKITLRIAMWLNSGEDVRESQGLINEYMKQNPGIEVQLVHSPWADFHPKILTMVAGGVSPDVIVVERRYLPSFALENIVMPIDEFLARDKDFDVRRDLTEIKSGVFRNKVYGIPIWGGPAVLRFNADLFEQYGVPSPLQYTKQQNWNWSTFVDAGRKLTKDLNGDGKIDMRGLESISTWIPDWAAKIRQNGGEILNEDGTKCVINTPESIQAIQFWLDLAYKYRIAPVPGAADFLSFTTGKVGMAYTWVTSAPDLYRQVKNTFKMDIAPMPAGRAGYFHIAGGCPVCISPTTRYPEEAYKLAKWYALEEGRKLLRVPASRKVFPDYLKRLSEYFSEPGLTLQIALSNAAPEPVVHPRGLELQDAWFKILGDAMNGKLSAEETIRRMEEATNRILAR